MSWNDDTEEILKFAGHITELTKKGMLGPGLSGDEMLKIDLLAQRIEQHCHQMIGHEIEDRLDGNDFSI